MWLLPGLWSAIIYWTGAIPVDKIFQLLAIQQVFRLLAIQRSSEEHSPIFFSPPLLYFDHYHFPLLSGTGRRYFAATTTGFAVILVLVDNSLLRPLPVLL